MPATDGSDTSGAPTSSSRETARPSPVSRARKVARPRPPAGPTAAPGPAAPMSRAESKPPAESKTSAAPAILATPTTPAARNIAGARSRERAAAAVLDDEPNAGSATDGSAPAGSGHPPEPPTSRAGRNLPAAIGVGLGLGAVIIVSLFVYRPSFAYIVGAAVLYGCYEVWKAFGSARIKIALLPLLVGSAAMLVAAWTRGPSGLVLAALVTVLGVFLWRLGEGAQGYTRDAAASAFVVLYLPLLAGFAVLLAHPSDGAGRVIVFVATVVCSDTGGYATGVLFGRHPLAPVVSKGKTWEGFAGSVVACSAAGVLFFVLTFHEVWWKGLLFGLAIVVTATLGDLGESMIKRDLEIKDMGSLLPGHGGVLDRLDSLLPCAVVAYLVLSAYATGG